DAQAFARRRHPVSAPRAQRRDLVAARRPERRNLHHRAPADADDPHAKLIRHGVSLINKIIQNNRRDPGRRAGGPAGSQESTSRTVSFGSEIMYSLTERRCCFHRATALSAALALMSSTSLACARCAARALSSEASSTGWVRRNDWLCSSMIDRSISSSTVIVWLPASAMSSLRRSAAERFLASMSTEAASRWVRASYRSASMVPRYWSSAPAYRPAAPASGTSTCAPPRAPRLISM